MRARIALWTKLICATSLHKHPRDAPGAPSLTINGSKDTGLFLAVISSLYIRLRYNKPLALVKNFLPSIAANLSRTRPLHPLRDTLAAILPLFPRGIQISDSSAVQPCSLVSLNMCSACE
jgi:hypothetical protein